MTPCLFYPIKICPASFSIISTTNPRVPPMERVQLGLTTFSSNTLPHLWRLLLSTPAKAAPRHHHHGARSGLAAPTTSSEASTLWPFPPQPPFILTPLCDSSPGSSHLDSPPLTSLPRHGNHDPGGPAGIPKTPSRMRVSLVPPWAQAVSAWPSCWLLLSSSWT